MTHTCSSHHRRGFGVFLVVLALVLVLTGCASAPLAPSSADTAAKRFSPAPDKARLYIFRDQRFGAALEIPVKINGVSLGHTAAGTYFSLDLAGGRYQVTSTAENDYVLDVTIEPGTAHFLRQEVLLGVIKGQTRLIPVEASVGRQMVQLCQLIALPPGAVEKIDADQPASTGRRGVAMDDLKGLLGNKP